MQAALFSALRLRNLPATVASIQADSRLAAFALPGELLDPTLAHSGGTGSIAAPRNLSELDHLTPRGLGELYEALAAAGRRSAGRFYTPAAVVAELTERALGAAVVATVADPAQLTICDPAMGCGFFLLVALELLPPELRLLRARHLYGIEQDPLAAMVTRAVIGLALLDAGHSIPDLRAQLVAGNALNGAGWQSLFPVVAAAGGFDVVLGNPPYVDSERMSRETPTLRAEVARSWPTARGNWDLFVPFVELALRLLGPGGRCALIVPNRLLGADYARLLRALLATYAIEALLDYSAADVFAAGVYPMAIVVRRRGEPTAELDVPIDVQIFSAGVRGLPQLRWHTQVTAQTLAQLGDTWWPVFSPAIGRVEQCLRDTIPLGALAHVREAATVAEAYGLVALLVDLPQGDLPDGYARVVNTGTLDRYTIRWGERPLRYLGQRYLRPAIEIAQLRAVHARLAPDGHQRVIMAGLGQRLEGYMDVDGTIIPAKTTVILTSTGSDLWALLALLNSQTATWLYTQLNGGLALRGGYLRVGKRQLARFPIPKALPAELGLLGRMRATLSPAAAEGVQIEAQIDTLVAELYGVRGMEGQLASHPSIDQGS